MPAVPGIDSSSSAAVQEGAEEVHVPAGELVRHPSPVARRDDRRTRVAVVRAVRREHRVTPGVQARHADRVLDRVGAAVRKEDLGEAVRRLVEDLLRRLPAVEVGRGGADGGEPLGLFADRGDDSGMLMPDVDVDQLAREVQQPVAGVIPHHGARAAGDDGEVETRLRGPGMEDVVAVELFREGVEVFGHAATLLDRAGRRKTRNVRTSP